MRIYRSFIFLLLVVHCSSSVMFSAEAHEWQYGKNSLRATFNGTSATVGGGESVPAETRLDYILRLQASRETADRGLVGAVWAIDMRAADRGFWAKDAFVYTQNNIGRIEVGWTESIAAKLSLLLPDVGGASVNNAPFFLPDDHIGITHPAVRGNQYAWRTNVASNPEKSFQFGIGRTFVQGRGFNNSTDLGIRYRDIGGRWKSSVSLGLSYIEKPFGLTSDSHLPPVFADARYQGTLGVNIQVGSIVWAATGKIISDNGADPTQPRSDGIQGGTGFSYDILAWSFSLNYIFSQVGVWDADDDYFGHTVVASARYKIDKNFGVWGSGGTVQGSLVEDWFFAFGLGVRF
ncbi:MAG: hypothetical protein LBQ49_01965 [Rickettsiales bacterium]|nr:hypothetical protein [Rickettsiales bacterium]